jgi:hypothetical protein
MLPRTAAPTSEENAFEIRFPQNRIALRSVSSRLVYHLDRMRRAPGRNAASTNPIKNRIATMPAKLFVLPESVEIMPQMSMTTAMYNDGRGIRFIIMLEGICIRICNNRHQHWGFEWRNLGKTNISNIKDTQTRRILRIVDTKVFLETAEACGCDVVSTPS